MLVFAVVVSFILIFCFYCYFENRNLKTSNYLIEQDCVPKEFHNTCFVCLTDLHENRFGKDNKKLLRAIHEAKPDYILIAGDMVNGKNRKNVSSVLKLLKDLAETYPVYYAPGNHELKWSMNDADGFMEYISALTRMGIIYLDNDNLLIKKGNGQMCITGINLTREYFGKGSNVKPLTQNTIEKMLKKSMPDTYHVLLAHMPEYFDAYANWGADLVISGHIHGGIVRLPVFGGVISPRYHLFPKYDAGMFKNGSHVMLISRGLGTHTLKIRVFNPPELMRVVIKNNNQES